MRTLIIDPATTAGFGEVLERRRRSGLDRLDEVWEGVLHMVPAASGEHADVVHQLAVRLDGPARAAGLVPAINEFNLGEGEGDFRVPDGGLFRGRPRGAWQPTAALVVEVVSPGDESWEKLPFYAAHAVDEVLIVDPQQGTVDWLALQEGAYHPAERSALIDLGPRGLAAAIDWPD